MCLHDGTVINHPDEYVRPGITSPPVSDLIKTHFKGVEATRPVILEPCLYTGTVSINYCIAGYFFCGDFIFASKRRKHKYENM